MSKFNSTIKPVKVQNFAGGEAYAQNPKLELVSILLTSMLADGHYRSGSDTMDRLTTLVQSVDPLFAAKAAIYARDTHGMRSITHVCASNLAKNASGQEWAKRFYCAVVSRPDDMLEILSYHKSQGNKISGAMKGGFATAFDKFDSYQLAKYRGEGKAIKLIDVVNLVHPVPTEKNSEALKGLVAGTLKSTETWEAKVSAAGNSEDKEESKKQAWSEMVRGKKLGYLALLRNLNNIMQDAPEVLDEALASLINPGFIHKSKVFPFQFLVAYKQFVNGNSKEARKITEALSQAVNISCDNVKELNLAGNTLVAVDNSGSMTSPVSSSKHMQMSELGALCGMVLAKAVNADIMEFGDYARYIPYRLSEDAMHFAHTFQNKNQVGHGTNFQAVLSTVNKKYDRIIIFSDMQAWVGYRTPNLLDFKRKWNADPYIYSVDLAGLGTMQFPENKVCAIAGFSDKIFHTMAQVETDKNALIKEIEAVQF